MKSGQVSFTFKYYPILDRTPQDGESHEAAYAAECANRQGKFWEYHDTLFLEWRGENVGSFTLANLKQFAVDLKLDTKAFNTCLDSGSTKSIVEADIAEGRKLKVNGTPAFFVNGQPFYPTALDASGFTPIFGGTTK